MNSLVFTQQPQALHASWLFIAMNEHKCIHLEDAATATYKLFNKYMSPIQHLHNF
jgi:hypothetical protein